MKTMRSNPEPNRNSLFFDVCEGVHGLFNFDHVNPAQSESPLAEQTEKRLKIFVRGFLSISFFIGRWTYSNRQSIELAQKITDLGIRRGIRAFQIGDDREEGSVRVGDSVRVDLDSQRLQVVVERDFFQVVEKRKLLH